jgi:hypothetical protein
MNINFAFNIYTTFVLIEYVLQMRKYVTPKFIRNKQNTLSAQPLTEMSTRTLPGGKGRPARKAENLAAICEPIV